MSDIPVREPKIVQAVDNTVAQQTIMADGHGKPLPNMMGIGTDYAVTNKFIMYIPIQNILGPQYKALELNLTRFSIPQVIVGSTSVSFKGYSAEFPTKVICPDTKEITFEYIVDANWNNYRALYCWAANIGIITPVTKQQTDGQADLTKLLPVRVYLLDQYKNKIIEFIYENCWVKVFQDLALDYTTQPTEVHHSFTLAYTNFSIADAVN